MTSKRTGLVDPLEHLVGYQLRRTSLFTLGALVVAFEALGLRLTEAVAMRFIAANPGCSQGQVSKMLGIKRTNMVPIVSALVERGMVTRSPADGRTHALALTDEGTALHARIVAATDAHEARFFGAIDPQARAMLLETLNHIRAVGGH